MANNESESPAGRSPVVLVVLALTVAGGVGFWWLDRASRNIPVETPVLTPEAKVYVRQLGLGDVQMKAAESYLRQGVLEILGNITNKGDRTLKLVQVNCVFSDPYGQVVLRERSAIAGRKGGPLQPGETRQFRLAFDNVPESWNQAMPQLVIAEIQFE